MKKELMRTIDSLDKFVRQKSGQELGSTESKENLEKGLVRICVKYKLSPLEIAGSSDGVAYPIQRSVYSNGLLITRNGYFLTSKHCLEGDLSCASITDSNGVTYPIERLCAFSKRSSIEGDDLALAKAQIPGNNEPMLYRIYNSKILKNSPVMLMTRNEDGGELKCYYGFTSEDYIRFADVLRGYFSILTDGGNKGDSGGIVVSSDDEIMGIISKSCNLCEWSHGMSEKTMRFGALATEFMNALKLVNIYRMVLLKRLHR